MLFLVRNSLVKIEVCCRDAIANSVVAKVRDEVLAHFKAVAIKVTAVSGIDSLAYQEQFP
jgi:hypothetical protein